MRDETKAVHLGRHPERFAGTVNTPVFRASTILSETVAEWEQKKKDRMQEKPGTYYGLHGTPNRHLLEESLAELEGGRRVKTFRSNLTRYDQEDFTWDDRVSMHWRADSPVVLLS